MTTPGAPSSTVRKLRFRVGADLVGHFAALTGDRSPIHVDAEAARRSRFRQPVVHGLLPLAYLGLMGPSTPQGLCRLASLEARFVRPIGFDDDLELSLDSSGVGFRGEIRRLKDGTEVTRFNGTWRDPVLSFDSSSGDGAADVVSLFPEPCDLASLGVQDLAGRTETLSYLLRPTHATRLAKILRTAVEGEEPDLSSHCDLDVLSILPLSTLLGMRLPGASGAFTDFAIQFSGFSKCEVPLTLSATVERASSASGRVRLSVTIAEPDMPIAAGHAAALVQPEPRPDIGYRDVVTSHADLGLRDRVVLITGASRGIGAATAKLFAALGARVAVHWFRGARDAARIVEELTAAGVVACAAQADLRRAEEIGPLFDTVESALGPVDVLVNNAVGEFRPEAFLNVSWESYFEEIEVSLKGVHLCCQRAVPGMRARRRGRIIQLSSAVVDVPVSGQSRYATVKSALVGYTRSLAVELVRDDVTVNLVVPSMTETSLLATLPPALPGRIAGERADGELLQPIEVAKSIAFLASDWARFITGQRIVVNHGDLPFI